MLNKFGGFQLEGNYQSLPEEDAKSLQRKSDFLNIVIRGIQALVIDIWIPEYNQDATVTNQKVQPVSKELQLLDKAVKTWEQVQS